MDNITFIQSDFSKFLAAKGLTEEQIIGVIKRLQEKKANGTDKTHLRLFQAREFI